MPPEVVATYRAVFYGRVIQAGNGYAEAEPVRIVHGEAPPRVRFRYLEPDEGSVTHDPEACPPMSTMRVGREFLFFVTQSGAVTHVESWRVIPNTRWEFQATG